MHISVDHKTEVPALYITGEIEPDDLDKFDQTANGAQLVLVILNSPGGNLGAALSIGAKIHDRRYSTYVDSDQVCASACGLIWVAGAKRLLAPTAKIGFHAAYDTRTGVEKGQGNAVVGAYLNGLGFGLEAILYATQAGPQDMTWLSQDDADRLGITYQLVDAPTEVEPQPFVRGPNRPRPQEAAPKITSGQDNPEHVARTQVESQLRAWNSDSKVNLDWIGAEYAPRTDYFGKMVSQQDIIADIRKNAARWPVRRYAVSNNEIGVSCLPAGQSSIHVKPMPNFRMCTVTATVEWHVDNQMGRRIGGHTVAQYEIGVKMLDATHADMNSHENRIWFQTEQVTERHAE